MKKLFMIGLLTLLCGCSINDGAIKNNLTEEFTNMANHDPISYTTMFKPLYSYYLPKDVGRIDSNPLSSLLMKDGVKFIMNFNPNRIVIHDYYYGGAYKGYAEPKIFKNNMNYYEIKGTFKGTDLIYHDYSCSITYLENDEYLLLLDMSYINFTAVLKRVQMQPIIHSMMTIGKSIQYDSKEVIALYSLKYTSDSITKDLEEFTEELPQNGKLSDLIEKRGRMMKNRLYHLDSEIQFYELQKRERPTVFIFSAAWCPDCLYLNTFLADVINEFEQFDFIYVDRDEFIDLCINHDILGIPSFVAYQNDKELGRFVSKNRKTKKEIEAFLGELL